MSDPITRAAQALYEDEASRKIAQPQWSVISTRMKNYYRFRVVFVLEAVAKFAAEDAAKIQAELDQ